MSKREMQPNLKPDSLSLYRKDENWKEAILKLEGKGKKKEIQRALKDFYAADIAFLLESLDLSQGLNLFKELDQQRQGEVLSELHDPSCQHYLKNLNSEILSSILRLQPSGRVISLLEKIEEERRNILLDSFPEEQRKHIIEQLAYPKDTAGGIMRKEYLSVRIDDSVKKVISALRNSPYKESIHNVFVCDKEGRYQGHISLSRLVLVRPQSKVKHILEKELMPIPIETDREEVAQLFNRYNFISAPVVDGAGLLQGRITADDALEVLQREASEDILCMGGLVGGEEEMNTPLLQASAHRVSWLILNLMTAFFSALVIRLFDQTIEKAVMLAALMPIVTSLGGSAGAQSMAIGVRDIALGESSLRTIRKLLGREFLISFLNGFLIASITTLIVYFSTESSLLSGIIYFALLCNIVMATLSGALVPRILHYFKIDPAVASVIIVSSLSDVMGFFVFLGSAYLML